MAQNQFVDALKLFLDTADSGALENLAARLKPYRIASVPVQRADGARSIPVIVLDGEASVEQVGLGSSPPCLSSCLVTPPAEPYFDFGFPWSPASLSSGDGPGRSQVYPDYPHVGSSMGSNGVGGLGPEPYCGMIGEDETQVPDFPVGTDYGLAQPTVPTTDLFDPSLDACSHTPRITGTESGAGSCQTPETDMQIDRQPPDSHASSRTGKSPKRRTPIHPTHLISSSPPSSISPSPHSTPEKAPALIFQSCIRKDYLDFLRSNLAHWISDGLWTTTPLTPSPGLGRGQPRSSYGFLENIYSCVSQLDTRLETDQVRKRVALVLLHSQYLESYRDWKALEGRTQRRGVVGVGRGDRTLMIDSILQQTTPAWGELSAKKRLQLRALFHERKRYGKRWAVLQAELGSSILLLCSAQLANMVSNTKVTMAALKGISRVIKECEQIMGVLRLLEPLAERLVQNDGYRDYQPGRILEQFETLQGDSAE